MNDGYRFVGSEWRAASKRQRIESGMSGVPILSGNDVRAFLPAALVATSVLARHLPRAALALARTIPLGFLFVLLSSGALVSSQARRGCVSLERTYRSLGRSQAHCMLATSLEVLTKNVARKLVQLVHASLPRTCRP